MEHRGTPEDKFWMMKADKNKSFWQLWNFKCFIFLPRWIFRHHKHSLRRYGIDKLVLALTRFFLASLSLEDFRLSACPTGSQRSSWHFVLAFWRFQQPWNRNLEKNSFIFYYFSTHHPLFTIVFTFVRLAAESCGEIRRCYFRRCLQCCCCKRV